MADLSWETVVAFLGTLVVVVSFLYKMMTNSNVKKEEYSELERRVHDLETKSATQDGKFKEIDGRIKDTNEKIKVSENFSENEHKKIESKLEKLTDLVIDFIQSDRR